MKELYNTILKTVCDICEVSQSNIFDSNKEEIVDAIYLLIYILSLNLTDIEISKISGVSKSLVSKVRNNFHIRSKKYSLKYKTEKVKEKIEKYNK